MEEFCRGMPPSYSQLEPESTASHIAAAGRLEDGDEGASKPEFWLPFLPVETPAVHNCGSLSTLARPPDANSLMALVFKA
jgi:hypothetical protein